MLKRQAHGPPISSAGAEPWLKTLALAIVAPAVLAIAGAFLALQIDNARVNARLGQLLEAQRDARSLYRDGLARLETITERLDGRLRLVENRP
jgi:hypothetical protein